MQPMLSEDLVDLSDVPTVLPTVRGRRPHKATIYRWAKKGVAGVRLESACLGHRRVTSRQALDRFLTEVSRRRELGAAVPVVETPTQQETRYLAVEAELERKGC